LNIQASPLRYVSYNSVKFQIYAKELFFFASMGGAGRREEVIFVFISKSLNCQNRQLISDRKKEKTKYVTLYDVKL
jgi:hypothetical protein